MMIHRSGNPFMQSQHRGQPMRLNFCASSQVLFVLPNETGPSGLTSCKSPAEAVSKTVIHGHAVSFSVRELFTTQRLKPSIPGSWILALAVLKPSRKIVKVRRFPFPEL